MLALATLPEHSSGGLTKMQTIEIAQPHCDSNFSAPSDPTKFYTAWDSMKTLQAKDLVYEMGRPTKKYALTEEGWEVAKKMRATSTGIGAPVVTKSVKDAPRSTITSAKIVNPADDLDEELDITRTLRASLEHQNARTQTKPNSSRPELPLPQRRTLPHVPRPETGDRFLELLSSPATSCSHSSWPWAASSADIQIIRTKQKEVQLESYAVLLSKNKETQNNDIPFQALRIAPGTFTIELVLDNREVRSKTDRDYVHDGLRTRGVCPIVRPLDLGDAVWVAKCKDPHLLSNLGEQGDEIILDWIVERKRLDDLVGSIKDGRFHEQKFRMHKSGIKNVIYIVEEIAMSLESTQKYHEHVMSAIASTQVVNGYFVKRTRNLDDTIRYLARMTMMLKTLYEVIITLLNKLSLYSLTPLHSLNLSSSYPPRICRQRLIFP